VHLRPVEEQVVAIVGASSGIGRETARRFARRGARLILAARGATDLQSLVQEIRELGGRATTVIADVTNPREVASIAERAVEAHGRLDTWVHLAAVGLWATFEQTTPEEFRQIIDVNLMGQAYGAMAALPYLRRAGGGALIHISSVEARVALPFQSAYAASKHGVDGFVQALRLELEREGAPISVTQVLPSSIDTPFFDKARTKIGVKPRGMSPIYDPGLVANAILHAAEHPTREIVVGGGGAALLIGNRVSPRLTERYLLWAGFRSQRSGEARSESAPTSLFRPLSGAGRVRGEAGERTRCTSGYTWVETHPNVLRGAILGGALAAAVGLIARASRERPH
jgi:NAD(P)-dependent dehydrogenase (short-subunit alcohol dehydrogenase family)